MSETKAPTILERIYAQRARDVEIAKSTPGTTPEDMKLYLDKLDLAPTLISFVDRLKNNPGGYLHSGPLDLPESELFYRVILVRFFYLSHV